MADQPPIHDERFKAEMPAIPGVGPGNKLPATTTAPLKIVGGLVAVVFVVVGIGYFVSRSHRHAAQPADPLLQVEVSAPDLGNPPPQAPPPMRGIARVDAMAKPWSAVEFDFRDSFTAQHSPALLLRLPTGSASQPSGYWALSLKAPYGNCQLELVNDLSKLKNDYGYRAGKYPMIGNPCSQSVFDPLKMSNLQGNVWVRGAMVQGSDLRPPLGIEVKIEGQDIFAVRME
ncbi:MAG TPA: hypothetical protein VKT53_07000 [Candidatus Acidoferrum sp.]|nr:hypothetical protein [Candidatus Acidoferrum sp.]